MTKHMSIKILSAMMGAAAFLVGVSGPKSEASAGNERFMQVLQKGELVVGVKADYKPYGFRNEKGEIVGLEVDLAQEVANVLGVKLQLVPVQSSNRMEFLQQGKIDLMIATMSDQLSRRKVVGSIDPAYYAAGTNVAAKKGTLKKWEDLKDKPVCAKQGAFYNKGVSEKYGAQIVAFVGNAEAKQALRDGKCVAWVFDDASIISELASGTMEGYEMPLVSEDITPWVVAVPLQERDSIWGNLMAGVIYNLHSTGKLVALEKKWGIQPTDYLAAQAKKFHLEHDYLK